MEIGKQTADKLHFWRRLNVIVYYHGSGEQERKRTDASAHEGSIVCTDKTQRKQTPHTKTKKTRWYQSDHIP